MTIYKAVFFSSLFILLSNGTFAQDDLMDLLDKESPTEKKPVSATFKGTRIILGHSVETKKKGELELLISHRFGTLSSGAHELWGLDNASMRLGFNYGVTDDFGIGIGRGSFDKSYDFYAKYKALKQKKNGNPITATLFSSLAIRTTPLAKNDTSISFIDRMAYTSQVFIARKFSSKFSLQITPTFIHKNRVDRTFEEHDTFAVGIGGRYKLTKSLSLNTEYFYRLNTLDANTNYNAFSIGVDIETGGHVFQLQLTNSATTIERAVVTETSDDFFNGDIHFGFNISRTFQMGKRKG